MSDVGKNRAGTLSDWPVAVIGVGVLLAVFAFLSGNTPPLVTWLLIVFGVVALLIRRGAFTPRR